MPPSSVRQTLAFSAGAFPVDCRNQTWKQDGGTLEVMSWHIHYTTVTEDMPRFYEAFLSRFADRFNPVQYPGFLKHQCPFGPNFGSSTFECAQRTPLHGANTMPQRPSPAFRVPARRYLFSRRPDARALCAYHRGGRPVARSATCVLHPHTVCGRGVAVGTGQQGRGASLPHTQVHEPTLPRKRVSIGPAWFQLDVLKHPNTGCMHDDHSLRARWNTTLRDR